MDLLSILILLGVLVFIAFILFKPERNLDRFETLEEVTDAIRSAGLESSNLIMAIDFTKSNEWQGRKTFSGFCLHRVQQGTLNYYQQVISILGRTLRSFDDDGIIPAMGFGDVNSGSWGTFPLTENGLCYGFDGVIEAYSRIAPHITLSGPTNFAPVIHQAIRFVREQRKFGLCAPQFYLIPFPSPRQFHILIIVADGQVTQERETRDAIVEASNHPLSIVVVGVGDGPWDMMKHFDDTIPLRRFDNFQFVDYSKVTSTARNPEASFAMHALMEIPDQYLAVRKLGLL